MTGTSKQLLTVDLSTRKVAVCGVQLHDLSADEVEQLLRSYILDGQGSQGEYSNTSLVVTTPNPEILLAARNDTAYRTALNSAGLSLPDGFGIRLVSSVSHTVHGSDIAAYLMNLADAEQLRVSVVLRADGRSSAAQAHEALNRMAPGAEVHVIKAQQSIAPDSDTISSIKDNAPDIVLVALGFPHQEQWAATLADATTHTPSVIMSVGGTIDFWTGVARRAPRIFRTLHLEWFWRLITEPRRRFPRIVRAVLIFPLVALFVSPFSRHP